MKATALVTYDGIEVSDYWKARFKQAVKDIGHPLRASIETLTPESPQQRKFLHGGVIPLWCYLDGNDYRDKDILDHYFMRAKQEFLPEAIKIKGKIEIRGRSSKGSKQLNKLTESLIDMLCSEYGLTHISPVLNPENFKKFRDEIYGVSEYDDFISYAIQMKWL